MPAHANMGLGTELRHDAEWNSCSLVLVWYIIATYVAVLHSGDVTWLWMFRKSATVKPDEAVGERLTFKCGQ